MAMRSASDDVKKAAGLAFFAASSPARTILFRASAGASCGSPGGTISNRGAGQTAVREERGYPCTHGSRTQHYGLLDATLHGSLFVEIRTAVPQGQGYKTGKRRSNKVRADKTGH